MSCTNAQPEGISKPLGVDIYSIYSISIFATEVKSLSLKGCLWITAVHITRVNIQSVSSLYKGFIAIITKIPIHEMR